MCFSSRVSLRITAILMVCLGLLLSSCGGGDASQSKDGDQAELSTGVSPIITNKGFGQPGSAAEIAVAAKLQSSYFDGRLAGTAGGLTGSTVAPNGASSLTKAMLQTSSVPKPVYRFYNTVTGVHFYTLSEEEKAYVQANLPIFQYEGPTFLAYPVSDPVLSPVFRFYNRVTGTHFYTINEVEKDHVIATWPTIYAFEGVAWFASKVAGEGWVPIYRFFNKNTGTHFYTPNEAEKDTVVSTLPQFQLEGTGYFVRVPSTAPTAMQVNIERALVKAAVLTNTEAYLTKQDAVGNFRSTPGRSWVLNQVFLHNGSAYKVKGFLVNPDGTVDVSTKAVALDQAYDDLKFRFKANALAYDDNMQPLSAAQLANKRVLNSINKRALTKAGTAGIACLIPKNVSKGLITATDMEWGYSWEMNNCSINDLLQLDNSFVPMAININGTLTASAEVEHVYDQGKLTNYTTTSQSNSFELTFSGSLSSLARSQLARAGGICQDANGVLECEKTVPVFAPVTVVVAGVPVTYQLGIGFKFSVDINGNITVTGASGVTTRKGYVEGVAINERVKNGGSLHVPKVEFANDAEMDLFIFGFIDLGIGAEAANAEAYLVKLEAKAGAYGNVNVKVALPPCADYQVGVRVTGDVRILKIGESSLFNFENEINYAAINGSVPAGCSEVGKVRLGYAITGRSLYTRNYTAYPDDSSVDVYDAGIDLITNTSDNGLLRIDLSQTIGIKGKPTAFEINMLTGTTSTASPDRIDVSNPGYDIFFAKALINPGNTTYGDVIRFRIRAFDPSDRINTESSRVIEIRIEPALTAQPEFQTVISTSGEEQYFVRYNYTGATASMIRSGYLALNGATSFNFAAPGFGDVQFFKEIRIYNEDQRIYMRPTRLALLGKHDRDGNEKLLNVVERTDVVVDTIGISPVNPTVGQLVTLTVNGERLPAALAVTVPNCTGLQEIRSSGNVAKNNYATGLRVYECTASSAGTNLIARVGPANEPFVFSINPLTSCPQGQALQNGACVAMPTITNVSPLVAVLNAPTTFTVTGLNLPLTTQMALGTFASCQIPTSRSANGFVQICTPGGTAGNKLLTIMTNSVANGGTVIDSSRSLSVTAAPSSKYSLVGSYSIEECVMDNATGLIWEGKTASGPRAGSNTYTNFDAALYGTVSSNAEGYSSYVNSMSLCGFTDWRLPTVSELSTLVDAAKPISPRIDVTWFVNFWSYSVYWSSSPSVGDSRFAWAVIFDNGYASDAALRSSSYAVRLVRGGQ